MIIVEEFTLPDSDEILTRTYSDAGLMIIQTETGISYGEAIDPKWAGRTYIESDVKINETDESNDLISFIEDTKENNS